LRVPAAAKGLVIFAHGSGSSRFSRRNRQVAAFLGERGFATLLLDLLTAQEEAIDERTTEYRFDIPRLGPRVSAAADWAAARADIGRLSILAPHISSRSQARSTGWRISPPAGLRGTSAQALGVRERGRHVTSPGGSD
jgi:hypothetical protein